MLQLFLCSIYFDTFLRLNSFWFFRIFNPSHSSYSLYYIDSELQDYQSFKRSLWSFHLFSSCNDLLNHSIPKYKTHLLAYLFSQSQFYRFLIKFYKTFELLMLLPIFYLSQGPIIFFSSASSPQTTLLNYRHNIDFNHWSIVSILLILFRNPKF